MTLAIPFEAASSGDAPQPRASGAPVTARGVAKNFGQTRVLRDLDLHVPAGQFLAIVGRSGCGKSTLLRLIAGLDLADAGRIAIAEETGAVARMMFQEPRLLPWARVLANVEVGLGAQRKDPDARRRALEALDAVGLVERANEWPSVLSGGQKQRVALARALVSRPRLLALDEPLGALDALTRIEMQRLLERVWIKQGFTTILVTHDVGEAIALADRIVLIEQGAIALDLAVDLPRPRHRGDPRFGALEERILGRLLEGKA
jgi:sulfonate transport system ATP-binding protein